MASAFNNGTFSFNQEELKDWSKVVFELGFYNEELNRLHTIDEGVKYDSQIVLSSSRGLMGAKITGCTPDEITGIQFSDKSWKPVFEDFRLKHCSADVNQQDKLVNQMNKMNPDYYNIFEGSQSALGAFLVASILVRFQEEILRKVWFNDVATATVANGGNLTNGTAIRYFNSFDGFFKQFFTDATLVANNRVVITENAGASYDAQQLDDNQGRDYLRAVYKKADIRLRSHKDSRFYVTQSIYDSYEDWLENTENTGAGNTSTTENGRSVLKYRGKEVIVMGVWDRTIQEYYDNGVKWDKPNRIVFSTPDNLRIGTLSETDFHELDAFYDKTLKTNFVDGVYSIDSKIIEEYMVTMAY